MIHHLTWGVAISILSSLKNIPPLASSSFIGELGLSGQVRKSNNLRTKIEEAARLGIKNIVVPKLDEEINNNCKNSINIKEISNIKEAVENPQIESRNMIVKAYHKVVGDFKLAGNPIKMSSYKDEKTRGDIPDLDEHREKILKEFN